MAYEYTNLMRSSLEETAAANSFNPGIGLMNAVRSLRAIRGRSAFPARFQLIQFVEAQPHEE